MHEIFFFSHEELNNETLENKNHGVTPKPKQYKVIKYVERVSLFLNARYQVLENISSHHDVSVTLFI